jgi:hypothetical protein
VLIPRLTYTSNLLTVLHAITDKPVSCIFESTSGGPASIYYYLAHSTKTNQRSQSRIIRSSNLAFTERRSSVHTSQSRYSFHLPFQSSSRLSGTSPNYKPLVCSSPSASLFYRGAQSTAHPITFHLLIITPATYAPSTSLSVASDSLSVSGKMPAFGTRFDALTEEEEIEFDDESMDNSSVDSTTGHPVTGAVKGAHKKKSVSFKVKKGTKFSTSKRGNSSALHDSVPQDTKRPSTLHRSALASTFPSTTLNLVPLHSVRKPSVRGGGLLGSSTSAPLQQAHNTPTSSQRENLDIDKQQFQDAVLEDDLNDKTSPRTSYTPATSLQKAMATSPDSIPRETLDMLQETPAPTSSPTRPMLSSQGDAILPQDNPPHGTQSTTSSEVLEIAFPPTADQNKQPDTPTQSVAQLSTASHTATNSGTIQIVATTTQNNPHTLLIPSQTASKSTVTTTRPKSMLHLHTFRAQLTFGLKPSQKVNVADLFTSWIDASIKLLSDFALLPFDDEDTDTITSTDHIACGDPDFFMKYYGNHRSLLHGNLTGMVHFQTSTSWPSIKAFRSRYFAWLTENRVFINYTKFKTDTLVPCGFLVGAHPGHFRRNEAEEELLASLGLDPGEIPFQLSSRSVSVPIKEDDPRRYSFNAVIVETSTKHATRLRERFYELADPCKAISEYPYTGLYQFVPMVKSTDWPIQKIYQLAQLHSSIIDDLKTIYVHHIQDVNNVVDDSGYSLLQGLYGMTVSGQPSNDPKDRLIQSIHNTSKPGVKVVLVQSNKHVAALGQFSNLYNILQNSVNEKFHSSVFI